MQAYIEETASNRRVEVQILPASKQDLPLKKDGWQFNWRELARKNEEAMFFKLVRKEAPQEIEGMLMLTIAFGEMVQMNNVEIAPHNYGKKGKYDFVAGCLIAFACYKSFEMRKNHYHGFLSFESKTVLMELYRTKYGASHAMGQRMYFDKRSGNNLIIKYLGVDVKNIFSHG